MRLVILPPLLEFSDTLPVVAALSSELLEAGLIVRSDLEFTGSGMLGTMGALPTSTTLGCVRSTRYKDVTTMSRLQVRRETDTLFMSSKCWVRCETNGKNSRSNAQAKMPHIRP